MHKARLALFLVVVAALAVEAAGPRRLSVSASADSKGDGSSKRPFRRITDALERARAIRKQSEVPIVIQVAPGTYTGTFDPAVLAGKPGFEMLPIILNVRNLSLEGQSTLQADRSGLPTGVAPGTETLLISEKAPRPETIAQPLVLIAPTTDGGTGDRVRVSRFVLDRQRDDGRSGGRELRTGIFVDRASGFVIRQNLIRRCRTGLHTRLASGAVEGNLFTDTGAVITGGSVAHPAKMALRRNRAAGNAIRPIDGMALSATAVLIPLDLGANVLALEPLQSTFDTASEQDRQNIPDTLEATVVGNDFSTNWLGLRCFLLPPFAHSTRNPAQPITGSLTVTARENSFHGNTDYGVIVDAGFPYRKLPQTLTLRFTATFEGNEFSANGRNRFFFGFARLYAPQGADAESARRQNFKYLQRSVYQVNDLDGETRDFDYDNPRYDPTQEALENTLTLNRVTVAPGTRIRRRE